MRPAACLLIAVVVTSGGCFRYGFSALPDGSAPDGHVLEGSPSSEVGADSHRPDDGRPPPDGHRRDLAGDGPGATDQATDRAVNKDLAPDGPLQKTAPLQNTGADPLNTSASGSLTWDMCASSFTGEVVVKGLAAGNIYQLKLDQEWSVDYLTGKNLGAMCRTWDDTIWTLGDVNSVLPAPYTGVGPGNVTAANIGDYLSTTEQDALYSAGHKLSGYLLFAFFQVVDASTVKHTEDDVTPAKTITAKADGFHIPIYADFSWHTSTSKQKGAVTFPAGQYNARFLVTREAGSWPDPLIVQSVSFSIGCP